MTHVPAWGQYHDCLFFSCVMTFISISRYTSYAQTPPWQNDTVPGCACLLFIGDRWRCHLWWGRHLMSFQLTYSISTQCELIWSCIWSYLSNLPRSCRDIVVAHVGWLFSVGLSSFALSVSRGLCVVHPGGGWRSSSRFASMPKPSLCHCGETLFRTPLPDQSSWSYILAIWCNLGSTWIKTIYFMVIMYFYDLQEADHPNRQVADHPNRRIMIWGGVTRRTGAQPTSLSVQLQVHLAVQKSWSQRIQ